ncbi:CPBP family intramembrane glutamic endopeptidase [Halorussus marinus]|uniref:CPBP family intramembrane glutamic endopeptidase n=1 Tax=Halorussus marinus TaxID=2505976 RepID=UPI001092B6E1|nr:CPBP family intramembrane glutamic endopeptidase [Halorussus marinus]
MATDVRTSLSKVAQVPPVTLATLGVSLLALPGYAWASTALGLNAPPLVTVAVQWTVAVGVVAVAVGVEGRSLASVGFRRARRGDALALAGAAAAAMLVFAATDPLVTALGLPVRGDSGTLSTGVGLSVALVRAVTTGVVEEVLFRGYPIERLVEYAESPLLAGVVTWGAFTAAHAVAWPLGNLVQISAVAAVFTVVYLRRRSLVPVVGAHVAVWALSVLGRVYG